MGRWWVRSRRTRIISATPQVPRRRRIRRTVWHCLRCLQEICDASEIKLIITYPNATADSDADSDGFLRLGSNLPHRFSPEDLLDKDFPLILEHRDNNLTISDRDPISNGNTDSAVELKHAALAAANRLCPSGASVVVVKKKMVVGYG
ncbi:cytidine deaminase 1-like [Brassica napus]|uniref:cytidine deaminase 1-like n=1 Tax=Brassica napus TaxID=3708 RepID=UPI002078CC29|nr:cytidine deaminase 1-like [Brassica napus]